MRSRIDGTYVRGLALTDPGFDPTIRSEFRPRLVTGAQAPLLLDTWLTQAQTQGRLNARGRQRTDSTQVLAAMRVLNRLERVGETRRAALHSVAVVAPAWGQALAPNEWYDRYRRWVENSHRPKTDTARQALATVIGADGQTSRTALEAAVDQPWWREVPAVQTLRPVWAEPYTDVNGTLRWREVQDLPSPAELIASPDDPEARYRTKRAVEWVGDQVHLTATCAEGLPHRRVQVEPTPATTPDAQRLAVVHASLEPRGLLPTEHFVDQGDPDAQGLVESQRPSGVTRMGPVADDPSWQARAGAGFDNAPLLVDWDQQVVTCPLGKQSLAWLPNTSPQHGMMWEVRVARKDCPPCPPRAQGTRAKQEPRRIGLQAREPYEARQDARTRQTTAAFHQQ